MTTTLPSAPPRPLPVDLVDGPAGLLYLLPHAPLTAEDCEALCAALRAWAEARQDVRGLGAAETGQPGSGEVAAGT